MSGKRERHFLETKAEAEIYAESQRIRLENFGTRGASTLSPAQQEQAANAFALLQPHKVSLNEVVRDWISREKET